MKYNTFLFDFDYTLIDGSEAIVECFFSAFERLGLIIPEKDQVLKTIGLTLEEAFEQLTGISPNPESLTFRKYFVEKADEVLVKGTVFLSDAQKLLTYLKSKGVRIGIVTTKYRYRTVAILESLNADGLIDIVIGGDDVKEAKPSPEGLLKAVSILKVDKEKVIYTGDSYIDAQASMSAGIDFCGVATGTTPIDTLKEYPHAFALNNLSEFLRILKKDSPSSL